MFSKNHTLSQLSNGFTEGVDTKDLQEARALLEDLEEKAKRGNEETEERRLP
jgi:predicted ATPase